jgi:hypothetical protein
MSTEDSAERQLVVVTPSGDCLCEFAHTSSITVADLKAKIAATAGLDVETLALFLTTNEEPLRENEIIDPDGALQNQTEIYALVLQKMDVAGIACVAPCELSNEMLEETVNNMDGGDIVDLRGCSMLHDVGCLAKLEQMQALDIAGCTGLLEQISVAKLAAVLKFCSTKSLAKLTFGADSSELSPVTVESSMVEADLSNHGLGCAGAVILAAFLPKCQALTALDVSANKMGSYYDSRIDDFLNTREGPRVLAQALPLLPNLVKFTFGDSSPVTLETAMTEADISCKGLISSGV